MSRTLSPLILALLLLPPFGSAGGNFEAAGIEVTLTDDRHRCDTTLVGFCLFSIQGDSPGDATIDLHQNVRFLLVRVEPEPLGEGQPLLPDAALVLHGDELYVVHPVFRTPTETWNANKPSYPGDEAVGIEMDHKLAGVYYHGPDLADPTAPWGRDGLGIAYGGEIAYDQLGPFHSPFAGETDEQWVRLAAFGCNRGIAEDECDAAGDVALSVLLGATPNIRAGVEVYDIAVATGDASVHGRDHGSLRDFMLHLPKRDAPAYASPPRAPAAAPNADTGPRPAVAPDEPVTARNPPLEPVAVTTTSAAPPLFSTERIVLVASASLALGVLVAALYTRLARSRIFDHKTRNDVYARVQAGPPVSISMLARDLGLGRTTVRHHIHVLSTHGLVAARRQGRETLLFPSAAPPSQANAALLGRSSARQAVAAALLARPMTQREIQEATGLSQRLVSYHLDHMRRAGFVSEDATWPRNYAPTPALRVVVPASAARGRVQGATS